MNKCEELGFQHCWESTTPQCVYLTMPPKYPNQTRKCVNCGLKQEERIVQPEIKEWKDVPADFKEAPTFIEVNPGDLSLKYDSKIDLSKIKYRSETVLVEHANE